jgi:hypothetical protein
MDPYWGMGWALASSFYRIGGVEHLQTVTAKGTYKLKNLAVRGARHP